ncbi:MAG TPA: F0F1 ATP synthase subunit A, partial [Gemmatimonadales bacterium]
MNGFVRWTGLGALLLMLLAGPAGGQAAPAAHAPAQQGPAKNPRQVDVLEHLADSHVLQLPYWKPPYYYPVRLRSLPPVHVGGLVIDFSPTRHLVFEVLAALIVGLVFTVSARSLARAQAEGRPPKGFGGAMEATALWVRQEVILPNVGPHGEGYVPYLLTTFFFILACNLFGLIPWGVTATGNIAVTGALAVLAFVVIEVSGMRSLGFKGYMGTIFYLPPGLPTFLKPIMLIVMTPIELLGKLAKPFALAVRLFANM